MSPSPKEQLKSVARATTAPARNYINNHFEMTKEEVRGLVAQIGELQLAPGSGAGPSQAVTELANVVAETALFQSRMLADSRNEVAEMRSEIAELHDDIEQLCGLVDRLVTVIGAMNTTAQHPDVASSPVGE